MGTGARSMMEPLPALSGLREPATRLPVRRKRSSADEVAMPMSKHRPLLDMYPSLCQRT